MLHLRRLPRRPTQKWDRESSRLVRIRRRGLRTRRADFHAMALADRAVEGAFLQRSIEAALAMQDLGIDRAPAARRARRVARPPKRGFSRPCLEERESVRGHGHREVRALDTARGWPAKRISRSSWYRPARAAPPWTGRADAPTEPRGRGRSVAEILEQRRVARASRRSRCELERAPRAVPGPAPRGSRSRAALCAARRPGAESPRRVAVLLCRKRVHGAVKREEHLKATRSPNGSRCSHDEKAPMPSTAGRKQSSRRAAGPSVMRCARIDALRKMDCSRSLRKSAVSWPPACALDVREPACRHAPSLPAHRELLRDLAVHAQRAPREESRATQAATTSGGADRPHHEDRKKLAVTSSRGVLRGQAGWSRDALVRSTRAAIRPPSAAVEGLGTAQPARRSALAEVRARPKVYTRCAGSRRGRAHQGREMGPRELQSTPGRARPALRDEAAQHPRHTSPQHSSSPTRKAPRSSLEALG